MKIYKYKLSPDAQNLELPRGAKVVSAISQYGNIVIYALVEVDDAPTSTCRYNMFGTGELMSQQNISCMMTFLDTVDLLKDGSLVFHVFIETDFMKAGATQ